MIESKLKKAVIEVLNEEYAKEIPVHGNDYVFSDKFERKMSRLIKRRQKPYYKSTSTVGRRAACFVIALVVASCATILSVEPLRKSLMNYVTDKFDKDSDKNITESLEDFYGITYDLSDFDIKYEAADGVSQSIIYVSLDQSTQISFCQYEKSQYDIDVNTGGTNKAYIDINGYSAVYYDEIMCDYRCLIWDNGKYVFILSSNVSENALIEIAKSVQNAEK